MEKTLYERGISIKTSKIILILKLILITVRYNHKNIDAEFEMLKGAVIEEQEIAESLKVGAPYKETEKNKIEKILRLSKAKI